MSRIRVELLDLIAVVGLGLLAVGVALVSVPAALAIVGVALLIYAVLASRSEVPK